jgi:uncharacterized protein
MVPYWVVGFFVAAALIILPPGPAPAGFEEGYAAYERGDYHTAFLEFMPLAIAGDPRAQGMIALMREFGLGTPQDQAEAARWYRRSAEQGNPVSQARLGVLFRSGLGVPQDFTQAVQWSSEPQAKETR